MYLCWRNNKTNKISVSVYVHKCVWYKHVHIHICRCISTWMSVQRTDEEIRHFFLCCSLSDPISTGSVTKTILHCFVFFVCFFVFDQAGEQKALVILQTCLHLLVLVLGIQMHIDANFLLSVSVMGIQLMPCTCRANTVFNRGISPNWEKSFNEKFIHNRANALKIKMQIHSGFVF